MKLVTGHTFIMPCRLLAPRCHVPCTPAEATSFHVWGWHLEENDWWQLNVVSSMEEAEAAASRWEEVTALELAGEG
jgi:hypothetical protein